MEIFTSTETTGSRKAAILISVQLSLKSHPLWVFLYMLEIKPDTECVISISPVECKSPCVKC